MNCGVQSFLEGGQEGSLAEDKSLRGNVTTPCDLSTVVAAAVSEEKGKAGNSEKEQFLL